MSFSGFFGWVGGNAMTVIAFTIIFPAFVTVAIPDWQFNPDAYAFYGLMGSVAIFCAIMILALSTHHYVELITDGKRYRATRLEFQITHWLSIPSTISTQSHQSTNVQVSKDY